MADIDTIIESNKDSIKVIKFNKPARKNAIDLDMYAQITKILEEAAKDDNVTVTVITGAGDYFSSGNDLIGTLDRIGKVDVNPGLVLKSFVEAFINFPKTLIAIVNGPAIGIAATTLALFDLVFAAESAFFYTPFTKLGLVAEGCSSYTFPRLLGDRKAQEMLLFNHKMTAKEALDCGFINYLYKPEELQSRVWEKIIEVSKLPRSSLTACKQLVRTHIKDDLIKVNNREIEELEKVWTSEDYVKTLMDFMSKSHNKKGKL